MAEDCELTILLPCLNEEETLADCIKAGQAFLHDYGVRGEILVADNDSTDRSREIASASGARVVSVPERGYGAAALGGIEAARGRYVIMGDADGSYDFAAVAPFLDRLREGYDLVMGDRFGGQIKPKAMPPLHRYLGNPVLSLIGRVFFRSPVRDFHCGLRGFRRAAILSAGLRTTGMEFASEMVVKAALLRLPTTQVPITLYPDRRSRPPHLRSWSDGWRHLRFLLLFSPRWFLLYPGLAMVLVGVIVSGLLLRGPLAIGPVKFDVGTLMYASLGIMTGMQFIMFAALTKVFAGSVGLLPSDYRLDRVTRWLTLERGLVVGFFAIIGGMASSVAALRYWNSQGFGSLVPSVSLRLIIPGVVLFVLGFQVAVSAIFLSILRLQHK